MADLLAEITPDLQAWLARQHVFFVATAPLSADGCVNLSPKGQDSFRVLGPHEVAYVDLTGSGVETIAHLRENGRIVFMFCAFEGPPKIVRLHGTGRPAVLGTPEFEELRGLFPSHLGIRAIVRASIARVSTSCGYAVPRLDFAHERDTLARWTEKKGPDGIADYRAEKNARSIDGLPGIF